MQILKEISKYIEFLCLFFISKASFSHALDDIDYDPFIKANFSPKSKSLFYSLDNKFLSFFLWKLTKNKPLIQITPFPQNTIISTLSLNYQENVMILGSNSKISLFDLEVRKIFRDVEGASINKINLIKPLFQEKYSNLFFSLDEKSEISLWDIRTKKRLSSCSLNNKSNENLIYFDSHNDCSQFISGFDSGTIHVWDLQMMKPVSQVNLKKQIKEMRILEKNSLFVQLSQTNEFLFYNDYENPNDFSENFYENFEGNSKILYENSYLYTISNNYFNKWDVKNLENIQIADFYNIKINEILDFSLNFSKELLMILSKENNNGNNLKLYGVSLKNLKNSSENGIKIKKKKSESKNFTFYQSEIRQTVNLSSFLINREEKQKFEEFDKIFEISQDHFLFEQIMLDRLKVLKPFNFFWFNREKSQLLNSLKTPEIIFDAMRKISLEIKHHKAKINLELSLIICNKCLLLLSTKYENYISFSICMLNQILEIIRSFNKMKNPKILQIKSEIAQHKRIEKIKTNESNKYSKELKESVDQLLKLLNNI